MIVYAGEDEEYFTFICPEAWRALKGCEFRVEKPNGMPMTVRRIDELSYCLVSELSYCLANAKPKEDLPRSNPLRE